MNEQTINDLKRVNSALSTLAQLTLSPETNHDLDAKKLSSLIWLCQDKLKQITDTMKSAEKIGQS